MANEKLCFTIKEAAEELRVSPRTVWNLIDNGDLPMCGLAAGAAELSFLGRCSKHGCESGARGKREQ
ncbi:MAG: helix-turn-helix domain-containing protein [Thermogutta sp.]